jgi:hypothetical protein
MPSVARANVATPTKVTIFSISEPRDAIGHDVGNPTQTVATPPKDATFGAPEPADVIGNETAKPTPSVATPITATQRKDNFSHRLASGCQ